MGAMQPGMTQPAMVQQGSMGAMQPGMTQPVPAQTTDLTRPPDGLYKGRYKIFPLLEGPTQMRIALGPLGEMIAIEASDWVTTPAGGKGTFWRYDNLICWGYVQDGSRYTGQFAHNPAQGWTLNLSFAGGFAGLGSGSVELVYDPTNTDIDCVPAAFRGATLGAFDWPWPPSGRRNADAFSAYALAGEWDPVIPGTCHDCPDGCVSIAPFVGASGKYMDFSQDVEGDPPLRCFPYVITAMTDDLLEISGGRDKCRWGFPDEKFCRAGRYQRQRGGNTFIGKRLYDGSDVTIIFLSCNELEVPAPGETYKCSRRIPQANTGMPQANIGMQAPTPQTMTDQQIPKFDTVTGAQNW